MGLEPGAERAVLVDGFEMHATPRHAVCPATSLVFYEQTSALDHVNRTPWQGQSWGGLGQRLDDNRGASM
jgi:hypothetical protein